MQRPTVDRREPGHQRRERLDLADYNPALGVSARGADRIVMASVDGHADVHGRTGILDTTHFDTVRFPPPPWAVGRLVDAAHDGRTAYTPYRGAPDVLRALAPPIGELLGVTLDGDRDLALSPGTQGGLFATLSAIVDAGDRVALVDPDYLFSERILRSIDAEIDRVGLQLDGENGPELDWDSLERAFERGARVLVFSHPNNPTGAVYPRRSLEQIAELVDRYDALVVNDQLYARLVYDDTPYDSLIALPGMRERCLSLVGPSKTESLTGYRAGVVVGPASLIDHVEQMISVMSLRAPSYSQHVLGGWLTEDATWVEQRVAQLAELRRYTIDRLRELPWVKLSPQAGTAYLFPDVSALGLPDHQLVARLVEDARVLVSPGYQFGPSGVGHLRLCYARDEEIWAEALDRLLEVLSTAATEHRIA